MRNRSMAARVDARKGTLLILTAFGLWLEGSALAQAPHGCCRSASTSSPMPSRPLSWQPQLAQLAPTQLLQHMMMQAEMARRQALLSGGWQVTPPVVTPNARGPARQQPAAKVKTPEAVPVRAQPVNPEAEARRLGADLVFADPGQQERALERLKECKGAVYTQALADAIHKLEGEAKNKAREALAERLTRMKAGTLREQLRDDHVEVRRAAIVACALKEDKSFIPDLIGQMERAPASTLVPVLRAALDRLTERR